MSVEWRLLFCWSFCVATWFVLNFLTTTSPPPCLIFVACCCFCALKTARQRCCGAANFSAEVLKSGKFCYLVSQKMEPHFFCRSSGYHFCWPPHVCLLLLSICFFFFIAWLLKFYACHGFIAIRFFTNIAIPI